jgi:outer membrane cobalamin receptor
MIKTSVSLNLRSSFIALIIGAALFSSGVAFAEARQYALDIPAEDTAAALNDLARQASIHLLFPYDVASKTAAPPIKGTFTLDQALTLILNGSGLEIARQAEDTITLRVARSGSETVKDEAATQVIVTGSHIRGGNPTSPVHTVTRKDIDLSGHSQIGDLVRSLPENFSGGQNPGVIAADAANSANGNPSNASTINLRGLGTDATLVLLNGHRLAADSLYQGSDISGIPLGAVQRMEIVADGASALYGSDAVAGVVNIVMRKDYDGVQASARLGAATQGGGEEQTYGLLGGTSRANWHILGSYEYSRQEAITAGQRDFTSEASPIATLWQPQTRNSAYLNAGYDFTNKVSLDFDALVSDRDTQLVQQYATSSYVGYNSGYTPAYSAALTLKVDLPREWDMKLTAGASGSRNRNAVSIPAYDYARTSRFKNFGQYVEAAADGTLLHLPSGDVKTAIGVGYRQEGFQQNLPGSASYMNVMRNITSLYGEALIPLVSSSPDRTGLEQLELSLAARTENYSDFGTSTNPKIGLRYVPWHDLTLRASWGTSFKAPSFSQMYSEAALYLYPAVAAGYSGAVTDATALFVFGGNKNLKPETSTSWSLGADYSPTQVPGLKLTASAFHIDYTDRVVEPVTNVVAALSDPTYAPFVDLAPTADEQAALIASLDSFTNYSGADYDPSLVVAAVHDNYQNATGQTVSGVDVAYRQSFDIGEGTLSAFANATSLNLKQQTNSTLPEQTLSGTIFSAPDFKARGGVSWTLRRLTATAIVNYIAGETDIIATPNREVGSWTTVDASLAYQVSGRTGWSINLAVSNLFDRDPPWAYSPSVAYQGIYFDSTNASIVGRFVSLSLTKNW